MTDETKTVLKATPIAQKVEEQPGIGGDFFARHDGQLDGFLSPEASASIRARQASRARVMGLFLGAAAILFFAITIVKIGGM